MTSDTGSEHGAREGRAQGASERRATGEPGASQPTVRPAPEATPEDAPLGTSAEIPSDMPEDGFPDGEPSLLDFLPAQELQRMQDAFSAAVGLASVITDLEGRPLTRSSGFCRLCREVIRGTERGLRNCMRSDAALGAGGVDGPQVRRCASGGLLDAGAAIHVRGRHVANWLMGQVRDESFAAGNALDYARRIGADPAVFEEALREVPAMPHAEFERLSRVLHLFANQVSDLAHHNHLLRKRLSRQRSLESLVRHTSMHDALTGLPNRNFYIDRVRQAQLRGEGTGFAIIAIDLDGFSAINDRYGHTTGDMVLREIARRLSGTVRNADTVARIGGDEFAVLIEGEGGKPSDVARRIQGALRQRISIRGETMWCEAAIGIATSSGEESAAEDLLRNADMAMRQAKTSRRRIRHFSPRLREKEMAALDLAADMGRAIRDGQFLMLFQPIVSAGPQTVLVGFEALMRWQRPGQAPLTPDVFIPLAEGNGIIADLGRLALDHSCAFAARLRKTNPAAQGVKVCVNVSPAQFQGSDVASDVFAALRKHGLPGDCLVLEITESLVMKAGATVFEKIERLRAQGVRFSIDDFGVGYSNMSILTQLPLDALKIDISLVRHLETNRQQQGVVRAILNMAGILKLHVVAEGVERHGQLRILRDLGCPCCQGFLFARPLTVEQALAQPLPLGTC